MGSLNLTMLVSGVLHYPCQDERVDKMIKEFSDMAEQIEKKTDVSPLGKMAFLAILHGDYKEFDRLHVHIRAKKIGIKLLAGGKKD